MKPSSTNHSNEPHKVSLVKRDDTKPKTPSQPTGMSTQASNQPILHESARITPSFSTVKKTWLVELQDGMHTFVLEYSKATGKVKIWFDESLIEQAPHFNARTTFLIKAGRSYFTILIRFDNFRYREYLIYGDTILDNKKQAANYYIDMLGWVFVGLSLLLMLFGGTLATKLGMANSAQGVNIQLAMIRGGLAGAFAALPAYVTYYIWCDPTKRTLQRIAESMIWIISSWLIFTTMVILAAGQFFPDKNAPAVAVVPTFNPPTLVLISPTPQPTSTPQPTYTPQPTSTPFSISTENILSQHIALNSEIFTGFSIENRIRCVYSEPLSLLILVQRGMDIVFIYDTANQTAIELSLGNEIESIALDHSKQMLA